MWTEFEAPGAMSPNAQPSDLASDCAVTEHVPAPEYAGLIAQSMPLPAGSGSASVTDFAVPCWVRRSSRRLP